MRLRRRQPGCARLLIHVGRHKTGSTSFQQILATDVLAPQRILYPQTGRLDHQHSAFPLAVQQRSPRSALLLDQLEQECSSIRPTLTVLSSEVFCELAKQQPAACRELLGQLAARWDLAIVQVVREQESYFLSALKHQLRSGVFQELSPFCWYRHCIDKTNLLDHFWLHAGYPLVTLPYHPELICNSLVSVIAEKAHLSEAASRRLIQRIPPTRENASSKSSALYAAYFIYILLFQASCHAAPLFPVPVPITFDAFSRIIECDPALQAELAKSCPNDQLLLDTCRAYDQNRSLPIEQDPAAERAFLVQSLLYRVLAPSLAPLFSSLELQMPGAQSA